MPQPTAPQPRIPQRAGYSQSSLFEVTLFTVMVATIATVVLVVMWEYSWLAAVFLGGTVGFLAGVVIALLLRRPRTTPEQKPVGHAPRASSGDATPVVPAKSAEERPNTTLQARGLGSIPDAGGVGRPATPEARSPLDPAELPIAGAGGPLAPATAEEASEAARSSGSGSGSGRSGPGSDSGRTDGSGSGGAVPYDPATSSSEPIVKPATPRGAPEVVADPAASDPVMAEPTVTTTEGVEPVKPPMRDAPKEGGPDDLTQIRGIGPALESMLHRMGVYHFDQIASWSPAEVAWADENLEDFKGRVTRDDWVGQARELEAGRA